MADTRPDARLHAAPETGAATPDALVMFGATGDLASRMLYPSLFRLDAEGRLPDRLPILGVARSELDRDDFVARVRRSLEERLPASELTARAWDRFASRLDYLHADVAAPEGGGALRDRLAGASAPVFYLAVSPSLYPALCEGVGRAGLASAHSRVVLEKPIGRDLASSRALNEAVAAVFDETQTFRIDHYLGKETVQNLIALRFANVLFEPLWNSRSIDHVEITVAETEGVGERWPYYDAYGAMGDMLQNHMLQLLALVAMEPPSDLGAEAVRAEKVKVLRSLRRFGDAASGHQVVRGRYGAGVVEGRSVPSYAEERGAEPEAETFVALRADIDNWRWAGAPFYLRTGKRLPERRTQIVVQFRPVPHSIFGADSGISPNRLIIDLQPQEEIRLTVMNRVAGASVDAMALKPLPLSLGLGPSLHPGKGRRIAYERLILDVLQGSRVLFVGREEVEEAWSWLDGVARSWAEAGAPRPYPAGSWGPPAAFSLIGRDGREWAE